MCIFLFARLWHGQEFRGFENIPSDGGALIIWFHGPMPADYFGLIGEVWMRQRRVLKTVMDRWAWARACMIALGYVNEYAMDQITIKTPNPKCRLYWCLIEFIDWRYSESCWYF
jgi:hypothetical protein